MGKDMKNEFFDINKFPAESGILVFPISMSKISNSQNAQKCFEYMEHFTQNRKAVVKPHVGLNFVYGDYLYLHSDEKSHVLRNKFLPLIIGHRQNFINIIKRNPWYIQHAFGFTTWNQAFLECDSFMNYVGKLKQLYSQDKKLQKYIQEDLENFGKKKLDEHQLNFFLEEILLFYLIAKGKLKLHNEFVQGHEKWTLICYPGPPLKSEIYIFQKNPFKLSNPENKYENCYYDLDKKILYDYTRVDLETLWKK